MSESWFPPTYTDDDVADYTADAVRAVEHSHEWRFSNSRNQFVCVTCGATEDGQ